MPPLNLISYYFLSHLINVYGSENYDQMKDDRMKENMQRTEKRKKDTVLTIGNLNAIIDCNIIPDVKQKFNENVPNENGELLMNVYSENYYQMKKTYFIYINQQTKQSI